MPWELFEKAAPGYVDWYTTRRGRRTDVAERALLAWILAHFPSARSALEVGCGTGHFTRWLATRSLKAVGLDRSPGMLAEMRMRGPDIPAVLGDAHCLPFADGAFDLVLYVTALEFLEVPTRSLAEAARVARQGVILVVLNRWSLGGLSRRWGPQSRQPLLSQARDWSLATLRTLVMDSAAWRLRNILWASALFPGCPSRVLAPIPIGEVIGLVAVLTSTAVDAHEEGQGKPMGALDPTSGSQNG
jgi:SAM-dependent methyltransferase